MSAKLVYVTGIPGTGVYQALKKYREWQERMGKSPVAIISLEKDYLVPSLVPSVSELFKVEPEDVTVQEMLRLPRPVLYGAWPGAFADALEESRELREQGITVLLTFHATWYHQENREYVSALDFSIGASAEASADMVVTLIDDIYDIRNRLSRPRGLFHPNLSESPLLDTVIKLGRILDWRGVEYVMTERWADVTARDRDRFVFATKHPAATFDDLLRAEKKVVYMAHPISEIRRGLRSSGEELSVAEETRTEITNVAAHLRNRVTLLEPTTIDEFRFKTVETEDESSAPSPVLSERWPAPTTDPGSLHDPLTQVPEFALGDNHSNFVQMVDRMVTGDIESEERIKLQEAINQIQVLQESIRQQIQSRDYALIEQASGLAIYRPIFQGNASSGVRAEIRFHRRLGDIGEPRAKAVILHPPQDELDYGRKAFKRVLLEWIESGRLLGTREQVNSWMDSKSDDNLKQIIAAGSEYRIGTELVDELSEAEITIQAMSGPRKTFTPEAAAVERGATQELGAQIAADTPSYLCNMEDDDHITIVREEMTAEQFAERVAQGVQDE